MGMGTKIKSNVKLKFEIWKENETWNKTKSKDCN